MTDDASRQVFKFRAGLAQSRHYQQCLFIASDHDGLGGGFELQGHVEGQALSIGEGNGGLLVLRETDGFHLETVASGIDWRESVLTGGVGGGVSRGVAGAAGERYSGIGHSCSGGVEHLPR